MLCPQTVSFIMGVLTSCYWKVAPPPLLICYSIMCLHVPPVWSYARYLERIIRVSELEDFVTQLPAHHKAITADGWSEGGGGSNLGVGCNLVGSNLGESALQFGSGL